MDPATNSPENVRLIIGLGNPDPRYARTYHNAGVFFVSSLLKAHPAKMRSQEKNGFEYARLPGRAVVNLFTFMNESGRAVTRARSFFKAKTDEILVVHDDSDLALGTYRFSFDRGAAGHHGVESVIAALRTKKFWRLRIGVRAAAPRGTRPKAGEFVLRAMTAADEKALYRAFDDAMRKLIVKESP